MNTEEDLFISAAVLPEAERAAYLDSACAGQPELRARVEALLRSDDATGFMEENAVAAHSPELQAGWSCREAEESGERVGRYRLMEKIGEGGFGVVWVADQTEPVRRRVALKIIKPGMDSREIIARFEQERQALAMMDHPGIARVFDAGATDRGRPYFVMELVRGSKITGYCDEAGLSTEERLRLFITVCQAVQHAHQKGIIHRDLKPSNILVTPGDDGSPLPKVIDFGVAKAMQQPLTDETVYTQFEQMIGTPAYMSPEQAGLGPMDVDTRSDVYSLGVLLYELLTGGPPFDSKELLGTNPDEMRRIIREVEPPRPSTRVSTMEKARLAVLAGSRSTAAPKLLSVLRGDLDWIVMKALEKDRRRRYETANGLGADIQRFLDHEPVVARPPSFGYRAGKFVRKHKGAVAAAAAVLVTLLGGVTTSTVLYFRERKALSGESEQRKRAEAGESAAVLESRKNEQTASFLKYMISGIKPSEAKGEDTKLLRKMMDRTAKQMGEKLKDQPEIQAQVHLTVGDVYQAIGSYAEALHHRESALAIFSTLFTPEHPLVLALRGARAITLDSLGRFEEAANENRAILPVQLKVLGEKHRATLLTKGRIATTQYAQGKYNEAEAGLREQIRGLEESGQLEESGELEDTLRARQNLASTLVVQGKYAEAEREYMDIIRIKVKAHGPDDPDALDARIALAQALAGHGKFAEAESAFRECLKSQLTFLEPQHPDVLWTRVFMADAMLQQDKLVESEAEHRDVLSIFERTLGKEHRLTLQSKHSVGNALHFQHKFKEAEVLQREVLEVQIRTLGADNPETLSTRNSLAASLSDQSKLDEAIAQNEQMLSLLERVKGRDHHHTLVAVINLANCCKKLGRLDKAREYASRAVEAARKTMPADHPHRVRFEEVYAELNRDTPANPAAVKPGSPTDKETGVRINKASALRAQGKYDEAEKEIRAALALMNEETDGRTNNWLYGRMALASILRGQSKPAEAETVFRALIPVMESVLSPEHPDTLKARQNLANALYDQGRFEETENECRTVLAIRLRVLTPAHPDVLAGRQNLANALSKRGHLEEAENEYKTLLVDAPACYGSTHPQTLSCRAGYTQLLMDQKKNTEAEKEMAALLPVIRKHLNPGHPLELALMQNLAVNYARMGNNASAKEFGRQWRDACLKHRGSGHPEVAEAQNFLKRLDSQSDAAVPEGTRSSSPAPPGAKETPGKSLPAGTVIVAPNSEWKWLHPLDGQDPEKSFPGFHKAFPQPDFDDSKWSTGKDNDDPNGGFGYGLTFTGTSIGKPDSFRDGRTAYFRHTFKTTKAHSNLELRCRRDDGIIIYLDGREVGRDNMGTGQEAYLLPAKEPVATGEERVVRSIPLQAKLAPGTHVLAISVHNTSQASSDLRLGGVTLVELKPGEK